LKKWLNFRLVGVQDKYQQLLIELLQRRSKSSPVLHHPCAQKYLIPKTGIFTWLSKKSNP